MLPHGISGAVSLITGFLIILGSLSGQYALLRSPWILYTYVISTAMNAVAGLILANTHGTKFTKRPFMSAGLLQLGMVWSVFRFRPETLVMEAELFYGATRLLDIVFACLLVGNNIQIGAFAVEMMHSGGPNGDFKAIGVAVFASSFAAWLLSGYPIQMAYGGEEWLECVEQVYPAQRFGFSGYVYVPASWAVGAMLFGASLLNRKIIDTATFALTFGVGVMSVVFITVISQEVHIPYVSTQKLIVPCPAPAEDSFYGKVVSAMDTSVAAQAFLRSFDFEITKPEEW